MEAILQIWPLSNTQIVEVFGLLHVLKIKEFLQFIFSLIFKILMVDESRIYYSKIFGLRI